MRILVVEDEARLARVLLRGLREEGHVVDHCSRVADARAQLDALSYDVAVLDWMLPDGDGLELLRSLRREGVRTPVLLLTARARTEEKIAGLRAGADDYLAKPFDFEELLARIEALHRRSEGTSIDRTHGDVTLDGRHRALRPRAGASPAEASHHASDEDVTLTAREYALAAALFERAGEVRTRAELLREVWGSTFEGDPNVLDVYVGYLRQKLSKLARPGRQLPVVRAVRGIGFRLVLESAE